MKIFRTIAEMREYCGIVQRSGQKIGFVPTMGALHEGHLSLVRAARAQCGVVAASIFVNPTQFGPKEDFGRYPRSFERDCSMLQKESVDALFAPPVEEMYPPGATTFVNVEELSEKLCGRSRPGHFRGVATVVAKLFHIVGPDKAFFGQKDAAQLAILRRMVRDLDFPVEIVACPIVREADGLAMSSRNAYLDPAQRKSALVLYRALIGMEQRFKQGERNSRKLIEEGKQILRQEPDIRLDYLEIVSPETLDPIPEVTQPALAAVAAFAGTTRLIDNIIVADK